MLSWLMEDAVGEEKDPRNLTLRLLVVNFAAIHTTSRVSCFLPTYIQLAFNIPAKTFEIVLYQLLAQ